MPTGKQHRSDCFFGIHSDFHAKPYEGLVIGETLCEEEIREVCELLKPDFWQIDCKGHPGYTSYPSTLGNAMPQFACDPLAIWRRVTRECGVRLYLHFSGVYDTLYCNAHPDDRIIHADGTPDDSVRLWGKYADTYLIPQISELVETYDIDGIWIDGDCWSAHNDFHPETVKRFEEQTGISLGGIFPKKQGDPYFAEYTEFTRDLFRAHLRHYVDVLHQKYPGLEICSNWAFSDHMPEKICADVDFLSGDLNPRDCVNSARYAGRMLASQGRAWDLMSWGFRFQIYGTPMTPCKPATQLMQEAAAVISLGGAYQVDIMQFHDASPDVLHLRKLKPLADFIRARQPYTFGGKQIHDAALLVSTSDRYSEIATPFGRDGMEKHMGLTALLCDSGTSLEIVEEHTLEENRYQYPLIIVSELANGIGKDTVEQLRKYVLEGGSLLLVGTVAATLFANAGFPFSCQFYTEFPEYPNFANCDIGHKKEEFTKKMPAYFSLDGNSFGVTEGAMSILPQNEAAQTLASLHSSFRSAGTPFAVTLPYGKGKLGIIGANLGTQYYNGTQQLHRDLIRTMLDSLYDPLAKIEHADGRAEITCLALDGRLMLQLVNMGGEHSNPRMVTDPYIPPVENVCVSMRCDKMPQKLILQPEGRELPFAFENGKLRFTIDRIAIHSIVEVVE